MVEVAERVQKALQKGEQFLNTTKICFDFYKREQHQKTKKIAELSDPSNRILIKWIYEGT
jgi:hypothetical protein